jgi:hypothetical protein
LGALPVAVPPQALRRNKAILANESQRTILLEKEKGINKLLLDEIFSIRGLNDTTYLLRIAYMKFWHMSMR